MKAVCVNTLQEATDVLKQDQFDLLFLDNHLPDGLGIDYITQVKSNYPSVKIIMITAHDTGVERRKALSNGADLFLGKPLTRDQIFGTLNQIILQHSM